MSPASSHYQGVVSICDGQLLTAWQGDRQPPSEPGVYSLHAPHPFRRIRGETTVLYIGRSSDVGFRTAQIAAFGHNVSDRVFRVLDHGANFWPDDTERRLHLTAECVDDPELDEIRRLHAFERRHGELPPLNRNAPGYLPFFLIRRVADALREQMGSLHGFGPHSLRVGTPWDDFNDGVTYVDIHFRRVLRAQVAWKWPHDFGGARRPEWWPSGLPCRSQALHLFVVEGWSPPALPASRPSRAWHRAEPAEDWQWLLHQAPIPLPTARTEQVEDHHLAVWSLGSLCAEAPPLKRHATITGALASAWAHIAGRLAALSCSTKS